MTVVLLTHIVWQAAKLKLSRRFFHVLDGFLRKPAPIYVELGLEPNLEFLTLIPYPRIYFFRDIRIKISGPTFILSFYVLGYL